MLEDGMWCQSRCILSFDGCSLHGLREADMSCRPLEGLRTMLTATHYVQMANREGGGSTIMQANDVKYCCQLNYRTTLVRLRGIRYSLKEHTSTNHLRWYNQFRTLYYYSPSLRLFQCDLQRVVKMRRSRQIYMLLQRKAFFKSESRVPSAQRT